VALSNKKPDEDKAMRKLQFVKTVSDISSRFIAVSDIDTAISASLEDIGQTAGADRVYVFLVSGDGTMMSNTHEWVRAGVTPEKDNLQDLPLDSFPWAISRLQHGQIIHVDDVSAMPDEAAAEKKSFEAQDIKSLLIFPMESRGQFLGFMGLDNVKETGKWSKEHFELLRISAKIVSDALLHNKMDVLLMKQTNAMGERVKELNCLFGITQLFEKKEISLEEVLQETVNLIKRSWQYPKETCARILLNEREYTTENFGETEWKQMSDIMIYGECRGIVEVFYCGEVTKDGEIPFLKEERALLVTIAGLIGRYCERRESEEALLESEAKNRALLNAIPDMKFRIDRRGTFLEFIPAKESEPILSPNEFLGKKVFEILPAAIAEQTMLRVEQALKTGNIQVFEYRLPTPFPDGNIRDFEARLVACGKDEVLAIVRDITEKKSAEDRLRILATMDSLTEVLNRRSGLLLLRKELQFSKRNNTALSICYTDINNLKEINDTFGHREGDEVLRIVARILKEEVRESDSICRLGGDEFLIILPQCPLDKAEEVWMRVAARLKALNAIKMNPYKISLSHGFAEYEPNNPSSLDEMLIVADFEMYKDKRTNTEEQPPQKNP
jgi:diguanylate cyclase (GGDEF)-like protein/PAS domain S-box-containing protein